MWFLHNQKTLTRSVSHSPRRSVRAYDIQQNEKQEEQDEEEGKWTDRTCNVSVVTNAWMIETERQRETETEGKSEREREGEFNLFLFIGRMSILVLR